MNTLIKVADTRLGSTEEIRTPDGLTLVYSSRVRTLIDAVYDWSRFDSLPRAHEWIRDDLAANRVKATDLVTVTTRYGNQGTICQIGALLERLGTTEASLRGLQRAIRFSTSLIPWVPGLPKRGTAAISSSLGPPRTSGEYLLLQTQLADNIPARYWRYLPVWSIYATAYRNRNAKGP